MEAHHLIWFAAGQWAMLVGGLLTTGGALLWHDRGRRRTEARLHEEGKRGLLRARDKLKAELWANGSPFSERKPPSPRDIGTSGDVKNG